MKTTTLILAMALGMATIAAPHRGEADMPGMHGMAGMGPSAMAGVLGPELMEACHADLGQLGLPAEVLKVLEDRRFELQTRVIRLVGDVQVLRLEFGRLLEKKDFDVAAARKKAEEIGGKESEIRGLHLDFLSFLGSQLTPAQWEKLRGGERPKGAMPAMPGGMGMPPEGAPMMPGGMMKGM